MEAVRGEGSRCGLKNIHDIEHDTNWPDAAYIAQQRRLFFRLCDGISEVK